MLPGILAACSCTGCRIEDNFARITRNATGQIGGFVQVFILSVRSGAVGINLTSANYIFMMEPLMNPALDEQAVGRAWRMGQKRPVKVKRLVAKGTIDDTIVSLAKARKV
jgi:hypothetical protein